MTTATLEKRTSESINYFIDCSGLLNTGETIATISSIADDSSALTYGTPTVNSTNIVFSDGKNGAIGTVILIQISGGTLVATISFLLLTIRAKFITSSGNIREATVLLKLTNAAD
jgi:hypothetical protein